MSIKEKHQIQDLANLLIKNVQFSEIQFKDKLRKELKKDKLFKNF